LILQFTNNTEALTPGANRIDLEDGLDFRATKIGHGRAVFKPR
jgi:hypothetical protein